MSISCSIRGCDEVRGLKAIPINNQDSRLLCFYHYPKCSLCKDRLDSSKVGDYILIADEIRIGATRYKDSSLAFNQLGFYCKKCFDNSNKESFMCEYCNQQYFLKPRYHDLKDRNFKDWGIRILKGKTCCPFCYEPTLFTKYYSFRLVRNKCRRETKKILIRIGKLDRIKMKNLIDHKVSYNSPLRRYRRVFYKGISNSK